MYAHNITWRPLDLLIRTLGGLTKMHYWAVSENYVVIITASVPLLNGLLKGARRMKTNEGSYRLSISRTKSAHTQSVYAVGKDVSHACGATDDTLDESMEYILPERPQESGTGRDRYHSDVSLVPHQAKTTL